MAEMKSAKSGIQYQTMASFNGEFYGVICKTAMLYKVK
jgi:hypothetical protein